jgi:hypothetical protein
VEPDSGLIGWIGSKHRDTNHHQSGKFMTKSTTTAKRTTGRKRIAILITTAVLITQQPTSTRVGVGSSPSR